MDMAAATGCTCLDGADNLYKADLQGRLAFVMGNEANGVSPALLAAADKRVFIPMQGRAESLNVAMAAGIVMFEALRQAQIIFLVLLDKSISL